MVERHGDRPDRPLTEPAPTVACTTRAGSTLYLRASGATGCGLPKGLDGPAPAVTGKGTAWLEPSLTVAATEGRGCQTDSRRASRMFGRRLTPAECAALQAWPECPLHAARRVEDRYRIAGNAVPPTLAEAVARSVKQHMGGEPC